MTRLTSRPNGHVVEFVCRHQRLVIGAAPRCPGGRPEVAVLVRALQSGEQVVTTGLVLQELLQGFSGPKDGREIVDRFSDLPLLSPSRPDHIAAAALRNLCRQRGVRIGTVDALFAQLCTSHKLLMLSTDADFLGIAKHSQLKLWQKHK